LVHKHAAGRNKKVIGFKKKESEVLGKNRVLIKAVKVKVVNFKAMGWEGKINNIASLREKAGAFGK